MGVPGGLGVGCSEGCLECRGEDGGYPEGDGWRDAPGGVRGEGLRAGCRAPARGCVPPPPSPLWEQGTLNDAAPPHPRDVLPSAMVRA